MAKPVHNADQLPAVRLAANEMNLRNRIIRLAGLYRDLYENASDSTVDDTREDLFAAIKELREARR